MSSCAGFIPRRVLEFQFKGKRCTERPRRRWFSHLLIIEGRKGLARNRKVKTEDFSTIDLYKMETTVEEEEDMEGLT
jgi:hypothetical protein